MKLGVPRSEKRAAYLMASGPKIPVVPSTPLTYILTIMIPGDEVHFEKGRD